MALKTTLLAALILSGICCKTQTVSDIDGNTYNTVTIGSQVWMKENLKTTHYNNGLAIPTTTLAANNDSTSIFQWVYNNDTTHVAVYGRLYSWYALTKSGNVCPVGWHVPDNSEWEVLSNYLGGDSIAGAKMKEAGLAHWSATTNAVDNASSFTGLPGGFRGNPMGYTHLGTRGQFWSTTSIGSSGFQRSYYMALSSFGNTLAASSLYDNSLTPSIAVSNCGMSVRCISDVATGMNDHPLKNDIGLFPNPATNDITVRFENAEKRDLYIYTMQGALVLYVTVTGKTSSIALKQLANGTYILKIVGNGSVTERKFTKE